MRAVHAASLCEKTTLPLQKRILKPKPYSKYSLFSNVMSSQSCFTASLIARVHGKVSPLSKILRLVKPITEQSNQLRIQLRFAQFITFARHVFTWITEVETRNAHDV